MAVIELNYNTLSAVAGNVKNLAKQAEEYADNLSSGITRRFSNISGGASSYTSDANYYINKKISDLRAKSDSYSRMSTQMTKFAEKAKRIDKEVATLLANNQEKFLTTHEHLRIDDWKAALLNWLVDLKNSCPLFELIGNAINAIGTELSGLLDNIRHWFKCEGGKELVSFVLAIGGAVAMVLLFVASLPASGFFAICAAIGAGIAAVNAIANVITSYKAMKADDPAWAKIYGDQNKLSDILRETNFGNGFLNRLSYGVASLWDTAEIFCDVVNILNLAKFAKDLSVKFGSKFGFLKNYFGKNTGLLSYMKTAKWTDVGIYDDMGNVIGSVKKIKVNDYGIVETTYTPSSIWRGIKAYVMDSPIDCHTDKGIRTFLNQNFCIDIKDWGRSVFSVQAWKDTFVYNATNGGAISLSDWKKTFTFDSLVSNLRYNLKNNSLTGMFADSMEWKKRREYVADVGNGIKSATGLAEKLGDVLSGDYDFISDMQNQLSSAIKDEFGMSRLDLIDKLKTKIDNLNQNTYVYKSAHAGE